MAAHGTVWPRNDTYACHADAAAGLILGTLTTFVAADSSHDDLTTETNTKVAEMICRACVGMSPLGSGPASTARRIHFAICVCQRHDLNFIHSAEPAHPFGRSGILSLPTILKTGLKIV